MRTALVTGTSTGIGEATARRLASLGWRVFAGVRREADGEHLRALGCEPVLLDVADEQSIAAAIDEIGRRVDGLDALVNNAGVARGGPVEYLPLSEWREQFEVNVFGQVELTRVALPLLRAARGRIVFVGSLSGRISTVLMAPYGASKHAIEAIAESLRHELADAGIRVVVIEPGAVRTAIWGKGRRTAEELLARLPAEARSRYQRHVDAILAGIDASEARGLDPDRVAVAVERALTGTRPRARVPVGADAWAAAAIDRFLPDRLRDLVLARFARP